MARLRELGDLAPASDGIFRVEVETGQRKLLVSFAPLKEALRGTAGKLDERHFFINHTLHNRNNDPIYFYCRADFETQVIGPRVNVPFAVRPDDREADAARNLHRRAPGVGVGPPHHRLARRFL